MTKYKMNTNSNQVTRLTMQDGLLAGLPTDPSESEIQAFITGKIKAKVDLVEQKKIIAGLSENTALGKRDLDKLWKGTAKILTKQKASDLSGCDFYPSVDDHSDLLIEYVCKRIADTNTPNPYLFHRSAELVAVQRDEDGRALIVTVDKGLFKHHANNNCKFVKTTFVDNEEKQRRVLIPDDVIDHVFKGPRDSYPPLRRLTTVPTFTKGKVLTQQGYQDGILYDPAKGGNIEQVPSAPDEALVKECVEALLDLNADFSLDGMSREELEAALKNGASLPSFAHLLAYMLSSIVREMILGPCAGFLIRKDRPRSGATLLATTAERIATLQPPSLMTLPLREEEVQKTLISAMLQGSSYIVFDNIGSNGEIESDSLAAAMTAYPSYKGRFLGASKIASAPATAVWAFTGNRSALSPQLAERMLLIEVDPRVENPGARSPSQFKYDLQSEIEQKGPYFFWCLLVLVQNWIAKGCPEWTGTPLGGFERHAAIVGGILDAAGVNGFMENRSKLVALVKTDDPVNDFMDALISMHENDNSTVFKAGVPHNEVGLNILAFRAVLEDAGIAMNGFGYKVGPDGETFYPVAADKKIAQQIKKYVGTVREADGVSYRLVEVEGTSKKTGKLYKLEASAVQSAKTVGSDETALQEPKRKRRRSKLFTV
ncbi:hypothetical protein [uncultured Tateyamaria sp.]|uniref:hypothetical protein n=1 Tax=uncultured Tateyamaria sp. TaxID=455651 RepID=UPI002634DB02|nr:hypothetical protein [uncultured Tateyamaria sp.]